jgi:hypothetical protein
MAATPLDPTVRFIPPGVTQWYWVATITDKKAPTRSELDAGTDLTNEVSEAGDWKVSSDSVDAPDLGTRFTAQVPGKISVDGATLTCYMSQTGTDVRSLLTRDLKGFVVQFPTGDDEGANGATCTVFPVTVSSAPPMASGEDPATVEVDFTVTGEPAENIAVPATSGG